MMSSLNFRQCLLLKKHQTSLCSIVGGYDLGRHSIGDLRELAKSQLQYVTTLFPTTKFIWSKILPRSNWRYSENRKAMDRVRIRLNNAAATEACS